MPHEGVAAGRVFISYRRQDSWGYVNVLQRRLEEHFGDDAIVRDLSDIKPGVDFRHFITDTLNSCSVLLALIGPHWLSAMDTGGGRRLTQENDLVRAEIAQALQQHTMLVIPVLVGGARMPQESHLPPDISALCRRSAVVLDDNPARWDHDVNGLIDSIQNALREIGRAHV